MIEAARWLGVPPWDLVERLEWLPAVVETRRLVQEAEERELKRHADRR